MSVPKPSPDERFERVVGPGRGGVVGADGKLRLRVGDRVELELPFSEVCMHMRVAGRRLTVELVGGSGRQTMAQLFDEAGRRFSAPVLPGEAGIQSDGHGFYVPAA